LKIEIGCEPDKGWLLPSTYLKKKLSNFDKRLLRYDLSSESWIFKKNRFKGRNNKSGGGKHFCAIFFESAKHDFQIFFNAKHDVICQFL